MPDFGFDTITLGQGVEPRRICMAHRLTRLDALEEILEAGALSGEQHGDSQSRHGAGVYHPPTVSKARRVRARPRRH